MAIKQTITEGDDTLSQILAILILNEKGERIAIRYTPAAHRHQAFRMTEGQKAFEVELVEKACKQGARTGQVEIVMHKEYVCLYRNVSDVHLIIIGDLAENELLLLELMNTLYTALASITGSRINNDFLLKKLDSVLLIIDEMVEGSMIYEVEPTTILSRVAMSGTTGLDGGVSSQTTFNEALSAARDGILKSLFHGV